MSDDGTFLHGPIDLSLPPDQRGNIQNSQCVVYGNGSSFGRSSTDLFMNAYVSFKPKFAGRRILYLGTQRTPESGGSSSGWHPMGALSIP